MEMGEYNSIQQLLLRIVISDVVQPSIVLYLFGITHLGLQGSQTNTEKILD